MNQLTPSQGQAKNHDVVSNAIALLKQHYPHQSFQVQRMSNTLTISWRDGCPEREVYDELKKFEHRDPYAKPSMFCSQNGSVEYVVVSRRYSDTALSQALEAIAAEHKLSAPPTSLTLDNLATGKLNSVVSVNTGDALQRLLARYLTRRTLDWDNVTPNLRKGRVLAVTLPKQRKPSFLVRLTSIQDAALFRNISAKASEHHGRYLKKSEGAGYYGFVFSSRSDANAFNQCITQISS